MLKIKNKLKKKKKKGVKKVLSYFSGLCGKSLNVVCL